MSGSSSTADDVQIQNETGPQYSFTWAPVDDTLYGSSKTEKVKKERIYKPKPVYVDVGTQYRKEDLKLFCDDCLAGKNLDLENNESSNPDKNISINYIQLNVPADMLPPGMSHGSQVIAINALRNQLGSQNLVISGMPGLNSGQINSMKSVQVTRRRGVKRPSSALVTIGPELSNDDDSEQHPSTSTQAKSSDNYNDEYAEEEEEIRMQTINFGFDNFIPPVSEPVLIQEYVKDDEDDVPIVNDAPKFYGGTLQKKSDLIIGLDEISDVKEYVAKTKIVQEVALYTNETPPGNTTPPGNCEESEQDECFGFQDSDIE